MWSMVPVVPIRNHSARPPALQTRCSTSHHARSTVLAETLADVLFKWHRRQYVRLLQMRDVADSTVSYVGKLCHFEARSQGFMLFKFVVQHCTKALGSGLGRSFCMQGQSVWPSFQVHAFPSPLFFPVRLPVSSPLPVPFLPM